ncbi:MAG: hypothetical protein CMF49_02750 [Legionellales bacterium]|nr:hypothetical protein [Legionellales bacterium]
MECMQTWYQTTLGQHVLADEQAQVESILADKFGYYLVEFSNMELYTFGHLSPITYKYYVKFKTDTTIKSDGLIAELDAFPFIPDSLDCIILPHVLEFTKNPELILKEAWQSLRPNGYLLLLTFNPYSLMGIYKKIKQDKTFPFTGTYYSYRKLFAMLKSCDFHIDESAHCNFDLPFETKNRLKKHKLWLALAQLALPNSANVNIILARKEVGGITPIRFKWVKKATAAKVGSVT